MELLLILLAFAAGIAVDHFFAQKVETAVQRLEAAVKALKS